MSNEITWEEIVRRMRTPHQRRIARFSKIEEAARALVDAINAEDTEDITPHVEALAKALEDTP